MVTVQQLMKAAGVSRRTIANWQDAGLIPAPKRGPAKGGIGRAGSYPDDTVQTVRQIVAMRERGMSSEEIANALQAEQSIFLGQISPGVQEALRRLDVPTGEVKEWHFVDRETGKEVSGATPMTRVLELRDEIADLLGSVFSTSDAMECANRFVGRASLGWAIELATRGIAPVLCISPRWRKDDEGPYSDHRVSIVPDFLLGHLFGGLGWPLAVDDAQQRNEPEALTTIIAGAFILPVFHLLQNALKKADWEISGPTFYARAAVDMAKYTKPKKGGKKTLDAVVRFDYQLIRVAPGPYGWLMFTLNPKTARTTA